MAGSLRARLLAASALTIVVALGFAAVGMFALAKQQVGKLIEEELRSDLLQLANDLEFDDKGRPYIGHEFADPRFHAAYGGRYWQVNGPKGLTLKSRSLWDNALEIAPLAPSDGVRKAVIPGPNGSRLLALSRTLVFEKEKVESRFIVTSAVDMSIIDKAMEPVRRYVWIGLAMVSLFLLLASWLQMTVGLAPFERLRRALGAVAEGRAGRIEGRYPAEITPLIEEMNALLDAQERTLARARARASDLAHGLKTPLAILSAIGTRLAERSDAASAENIRKQVRAMKRHLERELARARASGWARTHHAQIDTRAHLLALMASMRQLPEADGLEWSSDLPEALELAVDRDDLTNMAANLLDNAQKWTTSRVHLVARQGQGEVRISIEDDGPGIPDEEVSRVVERGRRLDETRQGSGLGLAIVSDIVALYEGRLELSRSRLGGLCATIVLPTHK